MCVTEQTNGEEKRKVRQCWSLTPPPQGAVHEQATIMVVYQYTTQLLIHQVRVCWTPEVRRRNGEASTSTKWCAASKANLENYAVMTQAGVELCGLSSHWIEVRTVPLDARMTAELLRGYVAD